MTLYRLLRKDEIVQDGIHPKSPYSQVSVFRHVVSGLDIETKYISTCGSLAAVKTFKDQSNSPGMIVSINSMLLPSTVEVIDLRDYDNRLKYIERNVSEEDIERFHNTAKKFEEVVLCGEVPVYCLNYVNE